MQVTIAGLSVPYLEQRLVELQTQVTSLRTVAEATAAAVTRVDEDVQVIVNFLESLK